MDSNEHSQAGDPVISLSSALAGASLNANAPAFVPSMIPGPSPTSALPVGNETPTISLNTAASAQNDVSQTNHCNADSVSAQGIQVENSGRASSASSEKSEKSPKRTI